MVMNGLTWKFLRHRYRCVGASNFVVVVVVVVVVKTVVVVVVVVVIVEEAKRDGDRGG